jgi:hypothetical protein
MPPRIEHYEFGKMTIDANAYSADLIVLPDRVVPDWWRRSGHVLAVEDLGEVLVERPRILVIGTGSPGLMKVPRRTLRVLRRAGIEPIVAPTAQAVETYNDQAPAGDVAACFHLTC